MSKFVTGKELEKVIYDIIWEAEDILMIVSPFIKLDNYFNELFEKHINNYHLHIIITFGKNEGNVKKSLNKTDFEFFKKFPNISIVYVPNLHAKYYGNESKGVITSINLYDASFKKNIEFGVYSEEKMINTFSPSNDNKAWQTCLKMINESEAVFVKRPAYQKKLFKKKYIKSEICHDVTETFYSDFGKKAVVRKLIDFQNEIELSPDSISRPEREDKEITGYCIRTGKKIPFNPKKPLCEDAFRSWAEYGNWNYPENYCHKTGKKSFGKTSMKNPIMK